MYCWISLSLSVSVACPSSISLTQRRLSCSIFFLNLIILVLRLSCSSSLQDKLRMSLYKVTSSRRVTVRAIQQGREIELAKSAKLWASRCITAGKVATRGNLPAKSHAPEFRVSTYSISRQAERVPVVPVIFKWYLRRYPPPGLPFKANHSYRYYGSWS
jgi:hypothetical protein